MDRRHWAIDEVEKGWEAKCRCGWTVIRDRYWEARTATMEHYYVCPMRWETLTDDSI